MCNIRFKNDLPEVGFSGLYFVNPGIRGNVGHGTYCAASGVRMTCLRLGLVYQRFHQGIGEQQDAPFICNIRFKVELPRGKGCFAEPGYRRAAGHGTHPAIY
jgi:hypothetical protein